jgi:hypothetical protein
VKTYRAPGLLEGGMEFTVAVTAPDAVVLELQAARKASRPSAPTPASRSATSTIDRHYQSGSRRLSLIGADGRAG